MTQPDPLRWTPWWIGPDDDVEWCTTDHARFREPFFTDTINRCLKRPFNLTFGRTTRVEDLDPELPGLPVTGIVLHSSRCGSTLLSRLAAHTRGCLSLSEPPPLDAAMRRGDPRLVRAVVAALAQPRARATSRCVIKLDAWSTHGHLLLREALPEVPWVVLTRDPAEILLSQVALPGALMLPGVLPDDVVKVATTADSTGEVDYMAAVLGAILTSQVAAARDPLALVVDYSTLDPPGLLRTLHHLGVHPDDDALDDVLPQHAKVPSRPFVPDERERQITPEIGAAVERHCAAPYAALLALAGAS